MTADKIGLLTMNVFLLPGETKVLHLKDFRSQYLINDVAKSGMPFGIFCLRKFYQHMMGTLVELDRVIKRYPNGEIDIRIKAKKSFSLDKFYSKMDGKEYPGAKIVVETSHDNYAVDNTILTAYHAHQFRLTPDNFDNGTVNFYDIAKSLDLSTDDKINLSKLKAKQQQQAHLLRLIKYKNSLIDQEIKSKFTFYLN